LGILFVKLAATIGLLLGILGITLAPVTTTLALAVYGIATGILGLIIGYDARTYKLPRDGRARKKVGKRWKK
jgi:uncharacterized Tic20 family protein